MSLQLHHLRLSQSDRILWMLEEMQLPYELFLHDRDLQTGRSPQSLKDVTPAGTAPYLRDTLVSPPVELFESGAIIQYLAETYGPTAKGTKLNRHPGDPDYANSLQFFHFANTTLQASILRLFSLTIAGVDNQAVLDSYRGRLDGQLNLVDQQLSKSKYLAGDDLTIADIMTVFSVTTMRGFAPKDLTPFPNILRYLKDIASRPAYIETLNKGDHGMAPMIEPNTRRFTQFGAFRSSSEAN